MCYDSFISVPWLKYMCTLTHACVYYDSFVRVPWLIHMCVMTHSYVCYDAFMCVLWLIDPHLSLMGTSKYDQSVDHLRTASSYNKWPLWNYKDRGGLAHWSKEWLDFWRLKQRLCYKIETCCGFEGRRIFPNLNFLFFFHSNWHKLETSTNIRTYVICWHLATLPSEYLEIGHAATKGPGSRTFGEVGSPLIGVELSAPQRKGNSASRSFGPGEFR